MGLEKLWLLIKWDWRNCRCLLCGIGEIVVALGVGLKKWWLLCMWDLRNCCNLYVGLEKFWFLFLVLEKLRQLFMKCWRYFDNLFYEGFEKLWHIFKKDWRNCSNSSFRIVEIMERKK